MILELLTLPVGPFGAQLERGRGAKTLHNFKVATLW